MTPLPWPLSPPPLGLDPTRPLNMRERLLGICPAFVEASLREVERMRLTAAKAEQRFLERVEVDAGGSDLGPAHRRRLRTVEVETIADPDAPNRSVRRARVADPIARMVSRGELTRRHEAAANALRALVEATGLPSSSPLCRLGMPPGGYAVGLHPVGHGRATKALGRALTAAWPFGGLVVWVAFDGGTLDGFAASRGVRRADVPDWLKTGLTALADHFGCAP